MSDELTQPVTWVGVDVSKKKFDVFLERADGRGKSKVFSNNAAGFAQLLTWGQAQDLDWTQTGVCLEATGPYGTLLARTLHEAGVVIAIENPARIQAFARTLGVRVKTDKADAQLIARYAKQHPAAPLAAAQCRGRTPASAGRSSGRPDRNAHDGDGPRAATDGRGLGIGHEHTQSAGRGNRAPACGHL
ncbi:MAG: transposase [Thermoleophilia bacterium]|nr:transposase [Thermoleophilia bacterium]